MNQTIALKLDTGSPALGRAALDTLAVAGAMTLAAWARIDHPMLPAPFTLQTFVVLSAAYWVGSGRATAGMLLYMVLGLAGLPVFTSTFGLTFGYLAGFAATPWLVSRFRNTAVAMTAGTGLIYACGVTWLCLYGGLTPLAAVTLGVLPFLPGDALKAVIAAKLAEQHARE